MNDLSPITFDTAKSEAFAERLGEAFNGAALTLMTSLGHRTRLFDVFATSPNMTSAELAERAGPSAMCASGWVPW